MQTTGNTIGAQWLAGIATTADLDEVMTDSEYLRALRDAPWEDLLDRYDAWRNGVPQRATAA
jgi:hypothetical protein